MKISVLIPVYNENENILKVIEQVQAVDIPKEIIVVDDGSTDGTQTCLQNINIPNVKTFFHARNRGKGAAIRTAIKHVTGDIVIIQDADFEYFPQEYPQLIQPILDDEADVVYGSRFLGTAVMKTTNYHHYFMFMGGVMLLNFLTYLLYGFKTTDEATCYKVFKTEVLKSINLKCERFEFCPEVTAKVCKKKYRIMEIPIKYKGRTFEEGKKIGWRDGVEAIYTLIKYRFID